MELNQSLVKKANVHIYCVCVCATILLIIALRVRRCSNIANVVSVWIGLVFFVAGFTEQDQICGTVPIIALNGLLFPR